MESGHGWVFGPLALRSLCTCLLVCWMRPCGVEGLHLLSGEHGGGWQLPPKAPPVAPGPPSLMHPKIFISDT